MAREDYPDNDYEGKGRAYQSKLADSKGASKGKGKKLTGYEEYLLTKHFPAQERKFLAAQRKAGAKRKAVRRVANGNVGLLPVEGEEDTDANDANGRVFKRRSPSKVLLRTKDLCNGYF
jgi:hypothetical protein